MRPQLSITAWSNYNKVLGLYVPEALRRRHLATLTGPMMTALYAHLVDSGGRCGRPLSATTVRLVHRILHKALHDAVDAGLLAMNPADKAKPPKRVRAQTSVWTAEQAAAFLHQRREDRLAAAWLLALSCGLRRGELAGLRWQDVDLERCTLTVAQQRTTDSGSHVVLKEPKGTSRRTLDLGRAATAALQAHLHVQRRERIALGHPDPDSHDLVFRAEDFARLREPIDEWGSSRDVFIVDALVEATDWAKPNAKSQPRRTLTLTGTWGAGSVPGATAVPVFAAPCPEGLSPPGDGCRAVGPEATIDIVIRADGQEVVDVTLRRKKEQPAFDDIPVALVPD